MIQQVQISETDRVPVPTRDYFIKIDLFSLVDWMIDLQFRNGMLLLRIKVSERGGYIPTEY